MAVVSGVLAGALPAVGELSRETGLPQHILRLWETRFPQLRPLQRAGKRRYYRPGDVALVRRIDALLNREGYTIKGVQQLLATKDAAPAAVVPVGAARLRTLRETLAEALRRDAIGAFGETLERFRSGWTDRKTAAWGKMGDVGVESGGRGRQ